MSENEKQYKVDGMKCNGCVTNVTNALQALSDVQSCEVNLEAGTATVQGEVTETDVIAAITQAGFQASIINE